jgi:4'-phosphopantetheinyl transferase
MIRTWHEIPARPLIPTGEYQLWLAWLDKEDPDPLRRTLSEDELNRAGRLLDRQTAERFTVGRGILRAILGRYLSRRPQELTFAYGPKGKPALAGDLAGRLSFNVAHAAGLAIFAIAHGCEVGVDVEQIHPLSDLDATASIILSAKELAEFKTLPAAGKLEHFFTVWTCKEAILKASGTGFSGPVKEIFATFSRPDQLTLLTPAEGFKGALACL